MSGRGGTHGRPPGTKESEVDAMTQHGSKHGVNGGPRPTFDRAHLTPAEERALRDGSEWPDDADVLDEGRLRPDVSPDSTRFDRDLSWLDFNDRVLNLALDERTPLLERVKFLAIFSSNLDEFVMKRIGLLRRCAAAGVQVDRFNRIDPQVLLESTREVIRRQQSRQSHCFDEEIRPALKEEGIELVPYSSLSPEEQTALDAWNRANVFPILTPLAVDPGHRFPFISNLSLNFGLLLTEPGRSDPLFARVKVPNAIDHWIRVPEDPASPGGPTRFVTLHGLVRENLDELFPGMEIREVAAFRVTRDAEGDGEDEGDTLLELVETRLRQRRFARPVRLEIDAGASSQVVEHMLDELRLEAADVQRRRHLLDYTTLFQIASLDRPELKWPKWKPVTPPRLADTSVDIFSQIRHGDVLVHHPYESFAASAQRFIDDATRDRHVLAIKQTLYRTGRDSPFIESLIRAAERGKQVACLVELQARFDEQANVRLARKLERYGVHVAYGVVGLKTHCKAALVVRREAGPASDVRSHRHRELPPRNGTAVHGLRPADV